MPNPTPGETAYEAYAARLPRLPFVTYIPPYGLLEVEHRMAWEAAAQAVLAWRAQGVDDTGFAPPGLYRQPPHKENTP
jgi:hypothetical protein